MFFANHVPRFSQIIRFLTYHGMSALRTENIEVFNRMRIVGEYFQRLPDNHSLESLLGFEYRLRAFQPAAVKRCAHDQASFSAIQARALSSAAGNALTSDAPAMAISGLPPPLPPHWAATKLTSSPALILPIRSFVTPAQS